MVIRDPMAWIVANLGTAAPKRQETHPQIEERVLEALREAGPISIVMLAQRTGRTGKTEFDQLRNAIYRLLEKRLVRQVGVEYRGGTCGTRILWSVTHKHSAE